MTRIKIKLPETYHFTTDIPIRVSDINFAGHLGHDSVLTLMHEARARFFQHHGWNELDVDGAGIVVADAAIVYKSQAHYGDVLEFKLAVTEFSSMGCDMLYDIRIGERRVASAKTAIVFMDYAAQRPVQVPPAFKSRFAR